VKRRRKHSRHRGLDSTPAIDYDARMKQWIVTKLDTDELPSIRKFAPPSRRILFGPCGHPGCGIPQRVKGYCMKHYLRIKRHGSADVILKSGPKLGSHHKKRRVNS
jgi:hypothetical protein